MQGKQAKMVSPTQERAMLGSLVTTRYPARDRVMLLLSMKAGLRAKAMAALTWAMVTDAQGQVTEVLHVPNRASKGKTGGRTMPLHPELQAALVTLQTARGDMATPDRPILCSERGGGLSPATVRLWFHRLSPSLTMDGCSSHAGRRTFMTRAARRVSQVGGSLRDVQELAGHTSLAMTQRDIAGDTEAKRTLVALIEDDHCLARCVSSRPRGACPRWSSLPESKRDTRI
jgi:integrase/recombinase XerD